jgi:hypothetical protein
MGQEVPLWHTAIHEAGHAWAHVRMGKRFRYVTIQPRQAHVMGACRPWSGALGRRDPESFNYIIAAGPIAEAVWLSIEDLDGGGYEEHLADLLRGDSAADRMNSGGMLDQEDWISLIEGEVCRDFKGIVAVANRLIEVGTMRGPKVFDLLAELLGER